MISDISEFSFLANLWIISGNHSCNYQPLSAIIVCHNRPWFVLYTNTLFPVCLFAFNELTEFNWKYMQTYVHNAWIHEYSPYSFMTSNSGLDHEWSVQISNKVTTRGSHWSFWCWNRNIPAGLLTTKRTDRSTHPGLETARLGLRLFQSPWNLTDTSTAALPRCLLNFRAWLYEIWRLDVLPLSE